jgi:DNA excision repair protein ERCC-4
MGFMIKIIVDERERISGVPQILIRLGDHVVYKMLDVGDYIVADSIAIERKKTSDLVRSIFDGRLFDQVRRLSEAYEKVVILVQGSPGDIRMLTDKWASVYGSIARIILEGSVGMVFAENEEDAAYIIHSIAQKAQDSYGKIPVIHKKPRLGSMEEWQVYIVQSLPHIGPKLARRLLKRFGSVVGVFNASALELSRIEGLSEWKAQEIVRILRSPYSESRGKYARDSSPNDKGDR